MNGITVELIDPAKQNSDDGVVDSARISFAKRAEMFSAEDNQKLMKFLHRFKHWSPYGHERECYALKITDRNLLVFFENAVLAGFSWVFEGRDVFLSGSLWAWYENLKWLPPDIHQAIAYDLLQRYPVAGRILFIDAAEPKEHVYKKAIRFEVPEKARYAKIIYRTFRIGAPIWVARQLVKHQVHLCWNEESRRYIKDDPSFFVGELRKAAANVKQGSSQEIVAHPDELLARIHQHHETSLMLYKDLMDNELAAEIARGVLPLNSITNWVWTGSLNAWRRVCDERISPTAQKETGEVARQISALLGETVNSWGLVEQP